MFISYGLHPDELPVFMKRASGSIINELLPDEILGRDLFHYTSADGLLGILGDGVIRCSHIFYLNDIEENLNGWKFFFEVLDSYTHKHKNFKVFKKTVHDWFPGLERMSYENLSEAIFNNLHKNKFYSFVFSLSLVDDDLNQWRSYAEEPFGFSIRFKFDKRFIKNQELFQHGKNCRILMRRCVYKAKEKEEKIRQLLDYYINQFLKKSKHWENQLFLDVLTLSLFFKNEKFEAENECRIVVSTALGHSKVKGLPVSLLNMRRGKSFLVPYIELLNNPRFIKGVTIGPTPFRQHSYAAMEMLKSSFGKIYGHLDLKQSQVPYRSW